MLVKTQAIVLRSVKFRESSLVVTLFTESLGCRSYLVNGARTPGSKGGRGNILQAPNILDLVAYHQEGKDLQRLSEFRLSFLYRSLHFDLVRNAIALYLVELLLHVLKHPQPQELLFRLSCETLQGLDEGSGPVANLPLYFTLATASLLGFGIQGSWSPDRSFLDLQEGLYIPRRPLHPHFLEPEESRHTDQLIRARDREEALACPMNQGLRRRLLGAYLDYFAIHLQGFQPLKSPQVLSELMNSDQPGR